MQMLRVVCASTSVLRTLLPHEVISAITLGLHSVLLAGHTVGLARFLLVYGLFLLSLDLGVNLGAFGGLVAVMLGLLCLCQRNAIRAKVCF